VNKTVYEGFEIEAMPYQLLNGKWETGVHISRMHGDQQHIQIFPGKGLFDTRDEAIRHSLTLGRHIIDGRIPDCSVTDL
jgi:hypothetical protein